jgi:hypothetical protein
MTNRDLPTSGPLDRRSEREVPITGEAARRQPSEASDALTPQGTPITTPESDSQLLTCRSTVEYHGYKVFVGLRRELGDGAMPL